MIPITFAIDEDEYLYSYVLRLSKANCFNNPYEFWNAYMNLGKKDKNAWRGYEIKEGVIPLAEGLQQDASELFYKSSYYPTISLFLTPTLQDYYIYDNFKNIIAGSKLFATFKSEQKYIQFCPLCIQEEENKKGYFIFHLSHQIPGVKVCTKHKIPLMKYVGTQGYESDGERLKNQSEIIDLECSQENEEKYSRFVCELNKAQLNLDWNQTKQIIRDKMLNKNMTYKDLDAEIKKQGFDKKVICSSKRILEQSQYIDAISICTFLVILFGDFDEFIQYAKKLETPPLPKLETDEFECIKEGNLRTNKMYCKKCKKIFFASTHGLNNGIGCQNCNNLEDDDAIFRRIIEKSGNGEYEVLETFKSADSWINIKHKTCGNVFKAKPRSFLKDDVRCVCERTITKLEAIKIVEKDNKFKILNYISGDRPAKLLCNECGKEFMVNCFRHFIECVHCPICDIYRIETGQQFAQAIRDLVSDEYTLVSKKDFIPGKNKGRNKIRHNKCNQIYEYRTWDFLHGQRCPICTPYTRMDEFKRFLDKYTYGRYQCFDEKITEDGCVYIVDTQNNTRQKLTKNLVMQELLRPTTSNILPLEKKNTDALKEINKAESLWSYIQENYKLTDEIYFSDLYVLGYSKRELKTACKTLIERRDIFRYQKGIYKICKKNKEGAVYTPVYEQIWNYIQKEFPKETTIETGYIKKNSGFKEASIKAAMKRFVKEQRIKLVDSYHGRYEYL